MKQHSLAQPRPRVFISASLTGSRNLTVAELQLEFSVKPRGLPEVLSRWSEAILIGNTCFLPTYDWAHMGTLFFRRMG